MPTMVEEKSDDENSEDDDSPDQANIVGSYYQIKNKFASGSFGVLYDGKDIRTNQKVAIKVETTNAKYPQLLSEYKLYQILQDGKGFPAVFWGGTVGDYNLMVMQRLGKSLEDLYNDCGRSFSLKTVALLAIQMLSRIEHVHNHGFIHRDIKPANFLMGLGNQKNTVFLIDLGLSKRYRDEKTSVHIPYREKKKVIGTPRYVSINAHMGIEQCRRDDLESIGYMLMHFNLGKLPWQSLKARTKQEKYNKILAKKNSIPVDVLCKGFPAAFRDYLAYCHQLPYATMPDYDYCRNLFLKLCKDKHFPKDNVFDWMDPPKKTNHSPKDPSPGTSHKNVTQSRTKNVFPEVIHKTVTQPRLENISAEAIDKTTTPPRTETKGNQSKQEKGQRRTAEQLVQSQAKKLQRMLEAYESLEAERDKWKKKYYIKERLTVQLTNEVLKLQQIIKLYCTQPYPVSLHTNGEEGGIESKSINKY